MTRIVEIKERSHSSSHDTVQTCWLQGEHADKARLLVSWSRSRDAWIVVEACGMLFRDCEDLGLWSMESLREVGVPDPPRESGTWMFRSERSAPPSEEASQSDWDAWHGERYEGGEWSELRVRGVYYVVAVTVYDSEGSHEEFLALSLREHTRDEGEIGMFDTRAKAEAALVQVREFTNNNWPIAADWKNAYVKEL